MLTRKKKKGGKESITKNTYKENFTNKRICKLLPHPNSKVLTENILYHCNFPTFSPHLKKKNIQTHFENPKHRSVYHVADVPFRSRQPPQDSDFQDVYKRTHDPSLLSLPLLLSLLLISRCISLLSVLSADPETPCLFLFSPFASTSSSLETHPSCNA